MEEQGVIPRVNKSMLGRYVGRQVRLVGKVKEAQSSVKPGFAALEMGDNGVVFVRVLGAPWAGTMVEVVGMVNDDLSVNESAHKVIGEDTDLGKYNETVVLAHEHKDVFGW